MYDVVVLAMNGASGHVQFEGSKRTVITRVEQCQMAIWYVYKRV
jgi:hypothetical protein